MRVEAGTDILYHATNVDAAVKILKQSAFRLTAAFNRPEENRISAKYFLSTARTTSSSYIQNMLKNSQVIIFVIDGHKVSQKYKIVPINYWTHFDATRLESEDRILSDDPLIPITSGIVKELFFYSKVPLLQGKDETLYRLAKTRKIPIKFFKVPIFHKSKELPFTFNEDPDSGQIRQQNYKNEYHTNLWKAFWFLIEYPEQKDETDAKRFNAKVNRLVLKNIIRYLLGAVRGNIFDYIPTAKFDVNTEGFLLEKRFYDLLRFNKMTVTEFNNWISNKYDYRYSRKPVKDLIIPTKQKKFKPTKTYKLAAYYSEQTWF